MKINVVPIETYRQTAGTRTKRDEASAQEQTGAERPNRLGKISIPGNRDAAAPSIKARVSPSLLEGILSPEEKTELIRHFARFGDAPQDSHIYGAGSGRDSGDTGIKVDLKA